MAIRLSDAALPLAAILGLLALGLKSARASIGPAAGGNTWAPIDWPTVANDLPGVVDQIAIPFVYDDPAWDTDWYAEGNMPTNEMIAAAEREARNTRAFLYAIRVAEGTADPEGYRALFGHRYADPRLFDSFHDHPRIATQFTNSRGEKLWTSAAGAYQFLAVSPLPGGGYTKMDTWDRLKAKLRLPDFSPASQDRAALELISEAGAMADVASGRFDEAVNKVRGIWASLPGAGHAQPERSLSDLRLAYMSAGGFFA